MLVLSRRPVKGTASGSGRKRTRASALVRAAAGPGRFAHCLTWAVVKLPIVFADVFRPLAKGACRNGLGCWAAPSS